MAIRRLARPGADGCDAITAARSHCTAGSWVRLGRWSRRWWWRRRSAFSRPPSGTSGCGPDGCVSSRLGRWPSWRTISRPILHAKLSRRLTAAGCAATPSKEDWMQFPVRWVARTVGAVLAMTCALSIAAWAGGAGFGDDDDNSEEEG